MTTTALAVADSAAAALIKAAGFNREEIELIKSTVAVGATDMELALFLRTAKHRGLDVLARQMHFVKRKTRRQDPITGVWGDVMVGTMQTGIDGFRLIAERTEQSDGQDEPEFVYKADGSLLKATVRAYRKDKSRPFVGVAFWDEYADATGFMWKKMPHTLLAKCAEALALRKAFPENLAGMYTDDEMQQGDPPAGPVNVTAGRTTGTVTRIDRAQPGAGDSEQTIEQAQDDFAEAMRKAEASIAAVIRNRKIPAEAVAEQLATLAPGIVEWQALGLEAKRALFAALKAAFPLRRPPTDSGPAGGAPTAAAGAATPETGTPASAATGAPAAASPAPAASAPTGIAENPPAADMALWVRARLSELGIESDDDEDLLEMTGVVSFEIDGAVHYDWSKLSPQAQHDLVRRLQASASFDP